MAKQYLILFLWLLASLCQAAQYNKVINIGDAMPNFESLPSITDQTLSSSMLKSDVVVLVSLANHCPWVKGMDQGLIELVTAFKGSSVSVVGFSVNHRIDDRLPAMKVHAKQVGYNFEYIYDDSQALGRALGATRTPEYFVFNKARKLVYMGLLTNSPAKLNRSGSINFINGSPSIFYVQDAISATMAGREVTPQETRAHGCTVIYES
jgi:thiol-disulfide isomerase/thioredoxin